MYLLIIISGILFAILNIFISYKYNFTETFTNNTNTVNYLNNNHSSDLYNQLEEDIKKELIETYKIDNTDKLKKHNNNAKQFMLFNE
jgi:hypothetical protein